jgi:serine/threonine-protein kinase
MSSRRLGSVYKAVDPGLGRTVAIKIIKSDYSSSPELLKRFYREAQAVGNLQHPNIVVVYDLGEENGSPYLVVEYLNGIPLDRVVVQRQSPAIVHKFGIVIAVLNVLHYAHQHRIVHRDVKPASVRVFIR